jgi:hypothetical protein
MAVLDSLLQIRFPRLRVAGPNGAASIVGRSGVLDVKNAIAVVRDT